MCTVTYLPKSKGDFILTSSRDEATTRPAALAPVEYLIDGKKIVFPKDPTAGGSWIAHSEDRTACLLNGGFVKHISQPPYKKSRGLVLLDYFKHKDAQNFVELYDFKGIEPFTLIIIETNGLFEIRWDGIKIHIISLNTSDAYIWSSSTLYSDEIILKRKIWFQSWLNLNHQYTTESIRKFHRYAGEGNKNIDILMNRNDFLKTVSITSVEKTQSQTIMLYEPILN